MQAVYLPNHQDRRGSAHVCAGVEKHKAEDRVSHALWLYDTVEKMAKVGPADTPKEELTVAEQVGSWLLSF